MRSVILKDKRLLAALAWRMTKWHLRYIFTKRPSPLACGLYVTSRCNFRCNFCNIWRKKPGSTLPLSKAEDIVNNLSDLGCFYFSISGGEPLLFEGIFELLEYARKSRLKYIHMVTNGYLLDADKARRLNKTGINEISISIDGTERLHDKNRGVPGAYGRAIQAIENLKTYAPGITIVLNAIFSPEDPQECLHVVNLARRFDVYAKVQPLNHYPVFNEEDHVVISYRNISPHRIKGTIAQLRKEPRIANSRAFLDNVYNFFCDRDRLILKRSPCLFGYHHVEISEDGSVFPCLGGLSWKNGFSVTARMKDLLDSAGYRHCLEGLKRCKGCQRNYYICYYEPRITFPIHNFVRFALPL